MAGETMSMRGSLPPVSAAEPRHVTAVVVPEDIAPGTLRRRLDNAAGWRAEPGQGAGDEVVAENEAVPLEEQAVAGEREVEPQHARDPYQPAPRQVEHEQLIGGLVPRTA